MLLETAGKGRTLPTYSTSTSALVGRLGASHGLQQQVTSDKSSPGTERGRWGLPIYKVRLKGIFNREPHENVLLRTERLDTRINSSISSTHDHGLPEI